MELCDINLDDYIMRRWTPQHRESMAYFTDDVVAEERMSQAWKILEDITSGLAFIHFHKEIHRDLKPKISTYSTPLALLE